MVRICGRCGRPFTVTDLVLVVRGAIARHYAGCPVDRWPADWRTRLVAS